MCCIRSYFSANVTHLRLATQLDNLPSPTSQQTLADVLLPTGWPVNVLYPSETGWLMDTKCLPTVVQIFRNTPALAMATLETKKMHTNIALPPVLEIYIKDLSPHNLYMPFLLSHNFLIIFLAPFQNYFKNYTTILR